MAARKIISRENLKKAFLRTLKIISRPKVKRLIVLALVGPIGSGKSHISGILARKLSLIVLRADAARVFLREKNQKISRVGSLINNLVLYFLARKQSIILDSDAVNPQTREKIKTEAKRFEARVFFVQIKTPENLIIQRLKKHHYTRRDIFKNADEAIKIYFFRKKARQYQKIKFKPDFIINNAQPLTGQISQLIKKIV